MPFPQNEFFLTKKCIAGRSRGIMGFSRELTGNTRNTGNTVLRARQVMVRDHRLSANELAPSGRDVFSEDNLKKRETGLN